MKACLSLLPGILVSAAIYPAMMAGPEEVSRSEAASLTAAGWWECQDPISCDQQQTVRCEANYFGECWGPMPCFKCNLSGVFWQCGWGFWDHCVPYAEKDCNQLGAIESTCDQETCVCLSIPGGDPRMCVGSSNQCSNVDDP